MTVVARQCTCAGDGHAAVLLLGGRALVSARRGDGEGGGGGQGAAVAVQLPTRRHDHAVVVGEQGKLWKAENITLHTSPSTQM